MKTRRKRKAIKAIDIAASFAAERLAPAVRDDLRARKVRPRTVLRLFTPDHIVLHAWGGSDAWWNLDMRLRGPELKAKDAADTSRAAKATRISGDWKAFVHKLHTKPKRKRKAKVKRKWPTRPFPKRLAPR